MAFTKVALGVLFVAATCFAGNVENSKGKTFPPFTIFDDHHGNYVRVTGPLRIKINCSISKNPPYKLSDMVHYFIGGYSSVEVLSLFLKGTINYEGMPLMTYDGVDDQCIIRGGMHCPYPKNKYFKASGKTNFKDLGLLPIDAIIAEPFFSSSLLPWEHFTFWYYFSGILKKTGKLHLSVPGKAILKLVAVQFEDLWKVRKPVKEIGPFNLDTFDEVIEQALIPEDSDEHGYLHEVEPYAMWEYRNKILSDVVDVGEFDFTQEIPECRKIMEGKIKFTNVGTCHGFVIWVEFFLDEDNSWGTGYQTTSNSWVKHSKQGVHFVKDPRTVNEEIATDYRIIFEPSLCKMLFQFGEKVE